MPSMLGYLPEVPRPIAAIVVVIVAPILIVVVVLGLMAGFFCFLSVSPEPSDLVPPMPSPAAHPK